MAGKLSRQYKPDTKVWVRRSHATVDIETCGDATVIRTWDEEDMVRVRFVTEVWVPADTVELKP